MKKEREGVGVQTLASSETPQQDPQRLTPTQSLGGGGDALELYLLLF